jgi:hypothetical protein
MYITTDFKRFQKNQKTANEIASSFINTGFFAVVEITGTKSF